MSRLVPILAIIALFLSVTTVSHAQSTAPTVSTVAITSSPGTDNTYTTGDTITVGLTFSEAVTVDTTNGTPRITLDIGGQPRYAAYSGDGSSAAAQAFSYTALVSDTDTDGVSVLANSLALDGGTIQATDDSANATLTHSAMTFANHKVDTQVLLLRNLSGVAASPVTVSATQSAEFPIVLESNKGFTVTSIAIDVKTPSNTLDVTVKLQAFDITRSVYKFTYTGSVTSAGLQTFTLSEELRQWGTIRTRTLGREYSLTVEGKGDGHIELEATVNIAGHADDASGIEFNAVGGTELRTRLDGYEGSVA